MKANPTVAKDIAIYFLEATDQRYTPSIIAKTIIQAKAILEAGYTKDEIIQCIDWVINKTTVVMYSLGYISTMINKILENIKQEVDAEEKNEKLKKYKEDMLNFQQDLLKKEGEELVNETSDRNRRKANEFDNKSRERKKYYFDLFEESGKDN